MAPSLQGHTLGQRQKFYNELVDKRKTLPIHQISYQEDDIDNMIRIDVACKERNVEYLLDVFKCEDMLYVSRAINKSTWLITEHQYAHIVNPKYLHSELFPQMNAKAVTKLMLHIRRHLRDEIRVKAFYHYVNQKNPKGALRWLGCCSIKFIEKIVAARTNEIPMKLLKRLFKKSISIIRIFLEKRRYEYDNLVSENEVINEVKYLLKHKETAKDFLNILEICSGFFLQCYLNEKHTHMLMKTCQNEVKESFIKFHQHINLSTFVKYLKIEEIKPFLIDVSRNNRYWRSFETLTPFLNQLPREEILDFLGTLYGINSVDTEDSDSSENDESDVEALFYAIEGGYDNSFSKVYRWYRFAPFDVAFRDIKKFILAESAPEERHAMLIVLLSCATDDDKHIEMIIQYYHDKHINEPYLHKKTFIESVLSQFYAFKFNDSTWDILNALFHSSEVYIESTNKVQKAIISIIVRNILHDIPIHEVIVEKFEFETLKVIKRALSPDEKDKVFNYLHQLIVKKLNLQSTDSEIGMRKAIELLTTLWSLLNDWDKVNLHHRFVIEKIAELGEINKKSSWVQEMQNSRRKRRKNKLSRRYRTPWSYVKKSDDSINILSLCKMVKSYRKYLFEKSLILHASEEVLLNALKHDPGLLTRYEPEIDQLRKNNEISLVRFLSKLRIYWHNSLCLAWSEKYKSDLSKLTGHRSLVRGILTLLPQNKVLDFIQKYIPDENKIQWSEANEIELSIQKHIAKNMHITRPQLPSEVVLWYAKGDYLQYTLLSLSTMYYNLRTSDIRKYIALMLNAPVSLQKHGIRLAFAKYNVSEKIEMATKMWNKTKNSSIRAILFTLIFDLLCKEKKVTSIKTIWSVLKSFIIDLNTEENKRIYETLGRVCEVPLSVVGDFFETSYLFLKSLPEKANMRNVVESLLDNAEKFIEYLSTEFVEKSLLNATTDILSNYSCWGGRRMLSMFSAYLLCSKELKIQMQKYNNLLQPALEICIPKWIKGETYLLDGIQYFLGQVCSKLPYFVFEKEMKMPVEILRHIRDAILKGSLSVKEYYVMIRRWQLTIRYLEILDELKQSDTQLNWQGIRKVSIRHIATMCHDFILEDQRIFFPTIYILFEQVLNLFFGDFGINQEDLLKVLYEMLNWEDCPAMYMLVINMIPNSGGTSAFRRWKNFVKNKIFFYPSDEITMHYFRRFSDKYFKKIATVDIYDTDDESED